MYREKDLDKSKLVKTFPEAILPRIRSAAGARPRGHDSGVTKLGNGGSSPAFIPLRMGTEWMLICSVYPRLAHKQAKGRQDCERGACDRLCMNEPRTLILWKLRQVCPHLSSVGVFFFQVQVRLGSPPESLVPPAGTGRGGRGSL